VLDPVYRVWMRLGEVLARINTVIILGITFFVVVTPIGLIKRLTGGDPLDRKMGDRPTYWIVREKKPNTRLLMERRF